MAALVEAEPAGAAGDLGDLPRLEVAPLLAVELRRLREEQRLAGEVDPVPEDVGRGADLRATGNEAVDLLAARRERHRTVEAGDRARVQLVELACETDHGAAAEGDDDGSGPQARDRAATRPVEGSLPLEESDLRLRERVPNEWQGLDGAE